MTEYRFTLSYVYMNNLHTRVVKPKYGEKVAIDVGHDSNEEYYREKLSGSLTFCNDDFSFVRNQAANSLDTKFSLLIEYNNTGSWFTLLNCYFYWTDCDINEEDKIFTITPNTDDSYDKFLGGIDKEYDLIKLAPKMTPVMLDKRPCLQIYALGDTKISCFLSNMWWEADCNEERDESKLTNDYHFAKWDDFISGVVSGTHTPSIPNLFSGSVAGQTGTSKFWSVQSGSYYLKIDYDENTEILDIIIDNGNTTLFRVTESNVQALAFPRTAILNAVAGSGATGKCTVNLDVLQLYARMISDVDTLLGVETKDLPLNDIVENNRNYTKVSPVSQGGALAVGANEILSNDPTEWGIWQPNQYYTEMTYIGGVVLPVCKHRWSRVSYWIGCGDEVKNAEEEGRRTVTLKDAYLLTDVINALLNEIDPGRILASNFLVTNNPLNTDYLGDEDIGLIYIAPKSNLLNIGYEEPAQKAPISLRQVLDMLRNTYRCYWQLEGTGNLRIEHIDWFRKGGRYTGATPNQIDLTTATTVRNNKTWDYETKKYKYDKPDMPCRYEFGWESETTLPFSGRPLVMDSGFVNPESVEKIGINGFDADIDYLLLNPGGISKDGFAIMKAYFENILSRPITVIYAALIPYWTILQYSAEVAESVEISATVSGSGTVYAADRYGNIISTLDSWNSPSTYSMTWTLPAGTAKILVQLNAGGVFTLESFEPSTRKVTYRDWTPIFYDTSRTISVQNGFMAFSLLQRYYAYDLPCRKYSIGEGTYAQPMTARGVSKRKTQEVTVPKALEIDVMKTINTSLGYGKIRKMNINLSSEAAETTLEYDTE